MKAWRCLEVDGDNASHIYVKMIQTFHNIKADEMFKLISSDDRVKWETRYTGVEILEKLDDGSKIIYG